jgi:prepilin-type N-terminal cleavage/methylation domain-containing protein
LSQRRRGFTLVEVVVASAILLILLISLMASFASGVSGFKQAQLLTFAQNLAEFQAEDLKALAPSVLSLLCEGGWTGVPPGVDPALSNYANPSATDPNDAEALVRNARPFEYDSGLQQTDYNIIGVTDIVTDPSTVYHAGETSPPTIPTDPPFLLGSNISVESYPKTDPTSPTIYPFVVKLHKEAYPLFTKEIRVVCYESVMPKDYDPWDPGIPPKYHFLSKPYTTADYPAHARMDAYNEEGGDTAAMFAYKITIRYKLGTSSRVLFETSGVISAPYS